MRVAGGGGRGGGGAGPAERGGGGGASCPPVGLLSENFGKIDAYFVPFKTNLPKFIHFLLIYPFCQKFSEQNAPVDGSV